MLNTNSIVPLYIGASLYKNKTLSPIFEAMGISSDIISSADYATAEFLKDFKSRNFKYGISQYDIAICGRDADFFKDIHIYTTYRYSPYDSYGPCTEFLDKSYLDSNGYHVKMNVFLNGDAVTYKDFLFEVIGHEIAHAYDDYNELKSTGGGYSRVRDDSFRDLQKQNACMFSADDDEKIFGLLLHMIDDTETQSYQHEIAAEILNRKWKDLGTQNAKDYNKMLMDTYVMKSVVANEKCIKDIEESEDESFKTKILGIFNDVYGKKWNYGKMLSFIKWKFMKVRKKILQSAGGAFVCAMRRKLDYRNLE